MALSEGPRRLVSFLLQQYSGVDSWPQDCRPQTSFIKTDRRPSLDLIPLRLFLADLTSQKRNFCKSTTSPLSLGRSATNAAPKYRCAPTELGKLLCQMPKPALLREQTPKSSLPHSSFPPNPCVDRPNVAKLGKEGIQNQHGHPPTDNSPFWQGS